MLHTVTPQATDIDLAAITLPAAEVTDDQLVTRIRSGDLNAYGSIMRRYNQRLYRIARAILGSDAEALDTVQEAHIKAFTRLDSYQGSNRLGVWLSTITRNEALMRLRQLKREVLMTEEDLGNTPDILDHLSNSSPQACLENQQLRTLINHTIDQLPEDFRTVFVLRSVEQLNVQETADILDIKRETVKTRHFRAKRLLRQQIQAYCEEAGLHIYEVGGKHCDAIIIGVLSHLQATIQP